MPEAKNILYKNNGVYLITGGLGNIGFAISKHIAKKVQAKLVLICRSEIPSKENWDHWINTHERHNRISERIRRIKSLKALGAEVFIGAANVSDLSKMKAIVDQAERQLGVINGIIHAAGHVDEASFCYMADIDLELQKRSDDSSTEEREEGAL